MPTESTVSICTWPFKYASLLFEAFISMAHNWIQYMANTVESCLNAHVWLLCKQLLSFSVDLNSSAITYPFSSHFHTALHWRSAGCLSAIKIPPSYYYLFFFVPCSQVHKFMSHTFELSVTALIYLGLSHYGALSRQLTLDVFARAPRRHVLFCRSASVKYHLRLLSLSKVFLSTVLSLWDKTHKGSF